MYYFRVLTLYLFVFMPFTVFSEDISPLLIPSYRSELVYLINWNGNTYVEKNYEHACNAAGGYWGIIPWKSADFACYSQSWNSTIVGTDTYYCADGILAYYNAPANYCAPFKTCPNSTWKLAYNQTVCHRPDKACHKTLNQLTDFQLLAAIINSESTKSTPSFEEKAAIGKVVLRKADAWGYSSLKAFIKERSSQVNGVDFSNPHFLNIICINEEDIQLEYPQVYAAALNALDPEAIDYSNGACFWDGVDLERKGEDHKHYKWGYKFTDPSHIIFPSLSDTPAKHKKGNETDSDGDPLYWDWQLESTTTYGKTIFWKRTQEYLDAVKWSSPCK